MHFGAAYRRCIWSLGAINHKSDGHWPLWIELRPHRSIVASAWQNGLKLDCRLHPFMAGHASHQFTAQRLDTYKTVKTAIRFLGHPWH